MYTQGTFFDAAMASPVPYPANPSAVVVSMSGGLDSVATAVWARQRWPAMPLILWHAYLDGMDWPQTNGVIDDLAVCLGQCSRITLQAVYALDGTTTPSGFNGTMLRRVHDVQAYGLVIPAADEIVSLLDFARRARKGMPPTSKLRWCTDYFKIRVCNWWLQTNRAQLGPAPVLLTGERWAESTQRAKLPRWKWRCALKPCATWPDGWGCLWVRPVIDWRLHEVTRMVLDAGAPIHPGYFLQGETLPTLLDPGRDERGRARLSCVCCIFSNQHHIAQALQTAPEQVRPYVDAVQRFEAETSYTWRMAGPLYPEGGPLLQWPEP